jgi:NACHT domain
MRDVLRRLSGGQLFFVVLVLVLTSAVLLAGLLFGRFGALVAAFLEVVLLWVSRPIWVPAGAGATRVRIYSVGAAVGLAAGQPLFPLIFNALVASPDVLRWLPMLRGLHLDETPSALQTYVAAGVIIAVNCFLARPTAPVQADKDQTDFPELDYEQKRHVFVQHLAQEIRAIDVELSWSSLNFVPIDAEVEDITTASGSGKKIVNLLRSLRKSREANVILVVGDPGSGKSVALRKLCLDLLDEVSRGGRVPIYINLREWLPAPQQSGVTLQRWSKEAPPSVEELMRFVLSQLKLRADVYGVEFIDAYFKRMLEHGHVLFVMDSFDEIPQLIDNAEDGWLIDELSNVLRRFISVKGRGIVASRLFRRPTQRLLATRTFEIRPFTDLQIDASFKRFKNLSESLRAKIFRDRSDLVSLARNPFLGSLLGARFDSRKELPSSQVELFEDYLSDRLDRCAERMVELHLTKAQVFEVAVEIAYQLFASSRYGLELPVAAIEAKLGSAVAERVVELLTFARIGRTGGGRERRFSFVHRRIHEYFVVRHFIEVKSELPFSDIPSDSRGRDVMVLYAQVAPHEQAVRMLEFAWRGAQEEKALIARLHCLRFMREAFVFRKDLVREALGIELQNFIDKGIAPDRDLLVRKHSLEAAGLLETDQLRPVLLLAMQSSNSWLQETAFRSCKQLPNLTPQLENSLISFLSAIDLLQILRRRRELLFALSLSVATQRVSWFLKMLVAESMLLALTPIVTFTSLLMIWPELAPVYGFVLTLGFLFLSRNFRTVLRASAFAAIFALLTSLNSVSLTAPRVMIAAILVLILPVSKFYFFMNWRIVLKYIISNSASFVGITAVVFSIGFASKAFRPIIDEMLAPIGDKVLAGVMIAGVVISMGLAGHVLLLYVLRLSRDWWGLRKLNFDQEFTRSQLAMNLNEMRSGWGKVKFVQRVGASSKPPSGSWPPGFLLNEDNLESTTMLAQLEERWLGLDR